MGLGRGLFGTILAISAALPKSVAAQRLPTGVTPEHYSLTIEPDLKLARFSGSEKIDVTLEHQASSITLNAVGIEFASVKAFVWPPGLIMDPSVAKRWRDQASSQFDLTLMDKHPQSATVSLDPTRQQATFTFAQPLQAGPVTLQISYAGTLNNNLRGFYLSKTKSRSYGVTQFESTDARRAFPSFDEPALKATFDVSLTIDVADTAISNTPILTDSPGPEPGKHTLRFATTPRMSTYLVAWLVGDWACSEGKSEGVPIRVCATPDKLRLTHFALEAAKWDLKYYNKYFGIRYPMAKMDLIAIPDFEAGAMENFGCLTFRETELLVDQKDGSISAKKEVASTVAHEISHQWFGDMVTMQWWDNLWLNEGFATWMETKAASHWHPDWKYDQDVAVELDSTMELDEQPTTRPVRARAETPAEIDEMFDGIAYGKAGAVIGMVENWVGEEVFRKGVHEYLAAHLYGNATAEDFWNTQTRVSGQPVDRVMRSFVEQPGVPLVSLGDAKAGVVAVTESRFLLSKEGSDSPGSSAEQWALPLCIKNSSCSVVVPDVATVPVDPSLVLFANVADKGYYRTLYSAAQRAALTTQVESKLSPPERIGLLSDRWALMRAGKGTVGEYLDIAMAVRTDSNATVIDTALGKVEEIGKVMASDEDRQRLNAVLRQQFQPSYAALGKPGKQLNWEQSELRSTLYEALGNAGDLSVLAEAQNVTADLLAGHRPADATVADASVALAAHRGDSSMYDKMMAVAQNSTDPGLKADALHLLTQFDAPLLVIRTMEYAVSAEVRSQDSWALMTLLLERRETQDLAWQYLQQHWDAVSSKLTINGGQRIVEAMGSFCSAARRDEVEQFFSTHPVASERALNKSLESIRGCARLRSEQQKSLHGWLDSHTRP